MHLFTFVSFATLLLHVYARDIPGHINVQEKLMTGELTDNEYIYKFSADLDGNNTPRNVDVRFSYEGVIDFTGEYNVIGVIGSQGLDVSIAKEGHAYNMGAGEQGGTDNEGISGILKWDENNGNQ